MAGSHVGLENNINKLVENMLTLKVMKCVCKIHGDKRVSSILNHHKFSQLFPVHFNIYVMVLRPL